MAEEGREDELDQRIAQAKAEHEHHLSSAEGRAESRGWAVGVEFVGAVVVGGVVGFLADKALGTKPWIMIVLLVLGFVAGLRRAITTSSQFDTNFNNDDDQ